MIIQTKGGLFWRCRHCCRQDGAIVWIGSELSVGPLPGEETVLDGDGLHKIDTVF